jgi:hypothetical protein
MGCYDVFCPFCGGPLESLFLPNDSEANEKKYSKITAWFNKCTVLLENKKAKHGFRETGCNVKFSKKGEKYNLDIINYPDLGVLGIALHDDCWKLAKEYTNHQYVFEDFNIKKMKDLTPYVFTYGNYKPINKYWQQRFDLDPVKNKNDEYVLYSPLKNTPESKKNRDRILKNIKNFKVAKSSPTKKLKKDRPSPSESATLFKLGTKKKGNDGNMYIVTQTKTKVKRWGKL